MLGEDLELIATKQNMRTATILVFPCGSEVGLEIHRCLANIAYINLVGASSTADHGKHVYKQYYEGLPFITQPDFLEKLNELLEQIGADYIFPAMDVVATTLSDNREMLKAEVLTSEKQAVSVCQDKLSTYQLFQGKSFCPRFYTETPDITDFPVIVKPRIGYGSKGVAKIDNKMDLVEWLAKQDTPQVICEYLDGYEVTVDCFTDRHGKLRYAACRNRQRVRNGISVHSTLRSSEEEVQQIAQEINDALPLRGVWFFQLKQDDTGRYKLLEIATRVAGTMGLQRAAGINLPLFTVLDAMKYDVEIIPQCDAAEVDRALSNSFKLPFTFDELYVDFDDTIIVRGLVNTQVMQLLYQCVNKNIPIYLVTRHAGDIQETLKKHRISADLFEAIYHLQSGERKSDIIEPSANALFIDDSFSERRDIANRHGICVYGVESVEVLLDWRL